MTSNTIWLITFRCFLVRYQGMNSKWIERTSWAICRHAERFVCFWFGWFSEDISNKSIQIMLSTINVKVIKKHTGNNFEWMRDKIRSCISLLLTTTFYTPSNILTYHFSSLEKLIIFFIFLTFFQITIPVTINYKRLFNT